MYCPKCGSEIKVGVAFCPKCGAKLAASAGAREKAAEERTKDRTSATADRGVKSEKLPKPELGAIVQNGCEKWKQKKERLGDGNGLFASETLLRMAPALAGCAALLLVLFVFIFRSGSSVTDIDTTPILQEYLQAQIAEGGNEALYERCFSNEVEDLTEQLSKRLSSVYESLGFQLSGADKTEWVSAAKQGFTEYIKKKPKNQQAFAAAVAEYTEVEVTKQTKKGKKLRAEVTVSYLDLSAVNQKVVENSVSLKGFVELFAGGNLKQKLSGLATGDIAFLLDDFVAVAEQTDARKTYQGRVEFTYNKETERWEVSSVEDDVLRACFAVK